MNPSQQLAAWIQTEHPALYEQLFQLAIRHGVMNRSYRLRGFGQDDGTDLTTITVSDTAPSPVEMAPIDSGLQPVAAVDTSTISAPNIATPDASGGDIGGAIGSAASSVGNWLTSGGGLSALANVGAAYFKTQAVQANAQLQQQVLNAQVSRVQSGQAPLPITYAHTSDGGLVPVYNTGNYTGVAPSAGGISLSQLPAALNAAVQQGTAKPVLLPDGSTGYALHPTVLTSMLGTTGIPIWMLLLGGGVLLATLL